MAKIRAAKLAHISNISRPTPYSLDALAIEQLLELQRPQLQLRYYLDRAQYAEARVLFSEMIKTAKYPLESIWKIGVEIISKTTPDDLTDYLKAVYIGSSESLAPITFNVYIDQLMLSENWELALEEMELLYHRSAFHHPILLRKMAICAYSLWKISKEKLPETYFQDEEYDVDDFAVSRYEKLTRTTSKYLAETHKLYKLDVEILDMYLTFLDTATDRSKKEVISITLHAFKENPDRYMLFYLLKINQDDQYFKTNQLEARLKKSGSHKVDEMLKFEKRLQRIFLIFLTQLENNNATKQFIKLVRKNLFKRSISRQICEAYQSSLAYQLMRSSHDKKIRRLAKNIKRDVKKYLKHNMDDYDSVKEEEQLEIKREEEGEQENVGDNIEDSIPSNHTMSLFEKYLKHPLFDDE
ncbi:hypothetical protein [Parasitella parasitica]|uniref:Uncharacterized protein n=1 Tax=Parasitella parasitica TaxID=35722 RepID=A0A0B7NQL6_9FUNG|nr:hypothetical protein [Parasitella parasitica]